MRIYSMKTDFPTKARFAPDRDFEPARLVLEIVLKSPLSEVAKRPQCSSGGQHRDDARTFWADWLNLLVTLEGECIPRPDISVNAATTSPSRSRLLLISSEFRLRGQPTSRKTKFCGDANRESGESALARYP